MCLLAPCLPRLTLPWWNIKAIVRLPDSKYILKLDPLHVEPSSPFLLPTPFHCQMTWGPRRQRKCLILALSAHTPAGGSGRHTNTTYTHTVPGACAVMESRRASGSGENGTAVLAQFERALRLVVREIHVDVATFKRNVEQRLEEAYKGAKPLENMVSRLQEENQQLKEKLEALSQLVDTLPWIASQSSSPSKRDLSDLDDVRVQAQFQAERCSLGTVSSMEEEETCDPAGAYLLGGSVCVDSESSSSRSSSTAPVASTINMDASYECNVSCLFMHFLLSLFMSQREICRPFITRGKDLMRTQNHLLLPSWGLSSNSSYWSVWFLLHHSKLFN